LGELADYDGQSTHKAHKLLENLDNYARLESDPILIGVVALRDPPRKEVIFFSPLFFLKIYNINKMKKIIIKKI
jgi:hypothetical protein